MPLSRWPDNMAKGLVKGGAFLGAVADPARARGILIGAPVDFTASFRPGARLAPARIREVSEVMEEYSLALDEDLADHPFADLGDVELPLGNVRRSLEAVGEVVGAVVESGRVPFLIGGEHLVTLPAVERLAARYPDLAVVQFDAHTDLRDEYAGETLSHATVMRRVADLLPPRRLFQFGVRSATADEIDYARDHTRLFADRILQPLREALPELSGRPIYITVDIDVADPAFAPGTGTPEPGGVTAAELLDAVRLLRGCRVVGFDVVEVSPPLDHGDITSILAAKLLREAILSFC